MINLQKSMGPGNKAILYSYTARGLSLPLLAFFVYESSECSGDTAVNVSVNLSLNYPLMQ